MITWHLYHLYGMLLSLAVPLLFAYSIHSDTDNNSIIMIINAAGSKVECPARHSLCHFRGRKK